MIAQAVKAREFASGRSSSYPNKENQDPAPSMRHIRSMLHVDAPTLGPLKPVLNSTDYAELYTHNGIHQL